MPGNHRERNEALENNVFVVTKLLLDYLSCKKRRTQLEDQAPKTTGREQDGTFLSLPESGDYPADQCTENTHGAESI